MTNWTIFVLAFFLLIIASFLPRLYKSFKLLPLTPVALWQVKVKILGWNKCKIKSNSKKTNHFTLTVADEVLQLSESCQSAVTIILPRNSTQEVGQPRLLWMTHSSVYNSIHRWSIWESFIDTSVFDVVSLYYTTTFKCCWTSFMRLYEKEYNGLVTHVKNVFK